MQVYVLVPIVLANLFIAALSVFMYRRVKTKGDTAMTSFRLKPDETVKDFKIMMYAHGFEASVMVMVFFAGVLDLSSFVDLGRQLTVVYGVLFAFVFYRWYRRF